MHADTSVLRDSPLPSSVQEAEAARRSAGATPAYRYAGEILGVRISAVTLPGSTKDDDPIGAPARDVAEEKDLRAGEPPTVPGSAEDVEPPAEPADPGREEITAAGEKAWPPPRALWIETGVVLLVTTVPYVFYSIWFHWLPDPQALPFAYIESAYIFESVAFGALGLHFMWRSGEPLEEFGIVRPSRWDIPAGILVMTACWSTSGLAIDPFLLRFLPDASTYDERISLLFPRPQSPAEYGLLAISCAAVGLQEEIIYRGYLLPRLARLTGSDGAGLLIGTLIFALVHIYQGPHGVIHAAWFGLATGALFLVIRRIWPLALAHGLGNFLAIGWWE